MHESPDRQAEPDLTPSPINGQIPPVETRFKPGQSGNPGGWSKSFSIRHAIQRKLAENAKDGVGAETAKLAQRALDAAQEGNAEGVRAVAMVAEQAEGKLTEYVEQQSTEERTVILRNPPAPQVLPEGKA